MSAAPLQTRTASRTDRGVRRANNEDACVVWAAPAPSGLTVAVVCDGVGGANAGELASGMTVDIVLRVIRDHLDGDRGAVLRLGIETANREVYLAAQQRLELHGMGTTCTVLAVEDGRAHIGHVGDSRVYHLRRGALRQLTADHTLVAQLVAQALLTPEKARRDARRNIVTRAVGGLPEVLVDVVAMDEPLEPGDTFIVCSDGLYGPIEDAELARMAAQPSLDRACQELVDLANERGGPDNITVVLVRLEPPAGPGDARPASPPA